MKRKPTILGLLGLLSVSLVLAGCPHLHRPYIPRPRLPVVVVPVDTQQIEAADQAVSVADAKAG